MSNAGYNVYSIGQTTLIEAFNVGASGQPESPTDPRILLKGPDGTEVPLAVTESPTGHVFHQLYLDGPPGKYFYRIVTGEDAIERFFVVSASAFAEPIP